MVSDRACKLENAREWQGSQVSRTVSLRGGAANKVVQCCMLRARMLLSMAAPSVAALGASQVRAHPPASHPCTLMHMPSLHHCHRVLAGGCTEATRRARWAHCPRRAAVTTQCARRPFMSRRVDGSLWALWSESRCVRSACRYGHAGALRPLCSVPAYPSCSPIAQAHQPHRWGGTGAYFGRV